jgi:hypothetical protein
MGRISLRFKLRRRRKMMNDFEKPMVNLDRSVNCYFCADLVDERNCIPADKYNGEDGGSICRPCIALKKEKDDD